MAEEEKVTPMQIYRNLPQTNCKKCGFSSCMAFAVKMANFKASIDDCPVLNEPKYVRQKMALKDITKKLMKATPTNLVVHEDKCTGCGACVVACPVDVSVSLETSGGKGTESEESIMRVEGGILKVKNIELCRRFEEDESSTRPCKVCVDACPYDAIEFM